MKLTDKEKRRFILGSYFIIANKLQNYGDLYLKEMNLTTKQWLLLAVLEKDFEEIGKYPGIGELANSLGTSHQNVKQIANKLEKKGLVKLFKDEEDKRVLRVKSTKENRSLWETRNDVNDAELEKTFKNFEDIELDNFMNCLLKFYENVLDRIEIIKKG